MKKKTQIIDLEMINKLKKTGTDLVSVQKKDWSKRRVERETPHGPQIDGLVYITSLNH